MDDIEYAWKLFLQIAVRKRNEDIGAPDFIDLLDRLVVFADRDDTAVQKPGVMQNGFEELKRIDLCVGKVDEISSGISVVRNSSADLVVVKSIRSYTSCMFESVMMVRSRSKSLILVEIRGMVFIGDGLGQ